MELIDRILNEPDTIPLSEIPLGLLSRVSAELDRAYNEGRKTGHKKGIEDAASVLEEEMADVACDIQEGASLSMAGKLHLSLLNNMYARIMAKAND